MTEPALTFDVHAFPQMEWTGLIERFQDLSLLQTWEYGEAKAKGDGWRVERGVFRKGPDIMGAVQAMVRQAPVSGVVWINRGPLWRLPGGPDDPEIMASMLGLMRAHWTQKQGLYLRVAPVRTDADPILPAGYQTTARLGWASGVLDLTQGLDELRAGLNGKWRGHLSKAERQELDVETGSGPELFNAFLKAHRAFLTARGFATTLTPEILQTMQAELPEKRKFVIFLARQDGEVAGSILIARYGETAEYLAANLSPVGRKKNCGQLLVWRAIEMMKAQGYKTFDLSGLDPERTPQGIRTFKEGLNAKSYRLCNEVEALAGPLSRLIRWRVEKALTAADG